MNRELVSEIHKPKNSALLSPINILHSKTKNRDALAPSIVDLRSSSELDTNKFRIPGSESQFTYGFSKLPITFNSSPSIQTKLKIGQPNDKYEQEADRVAEQVMRMPQPQHSVSVIDSSLAKKSTNNLGESIQRACASCLEDEELIQTKTSGGQTPELSSSTNSSIHSLQGGGQPLSRSERSFFEPCFGADFSKVRVHSDARAGSVARSINAHAFTLGHNVVFGVGEYASGASAGRKLLAHELTHVVQQNSSEQNQGLIQRQEQADEPVTKDISPDPDKTSIPKPVEGSARVNRCDTNPQFPNFPCLASALKLDIDENLRNNAHQFYRVASLFPGDNERMWNTFQRYGLGINLLETSFGFLGANETLGTALSFGTGIGLKSYEFFQNGVLALDLPIPLGQGVKLDLQLDLNADPNNLSNVTSASAGVGFSGSF